VKVLLISFYHPELVRGGEQQICYELFEGLKAREGVEATLLASVDPSIGYLYKSGARITGFDGKPNEFMFLCRDYDYLWEKVSNVLLIEAYVEFLQLVNPDIVHFHHFLTYGIDLLTLTRRTLPNAKIIFTAHEFLTICAANGHMVRWTDQSLCTRASPVRCHQCRPEQPPEHYFMREMWMKAHLDAVDVFTTPSKFMIEHFVNWGLDARKFYHVTNGRKIKQAGNVVPEARTVRNRFGFFGQLVDVKGVQVILEAVTLLRADGFTDFVVEINGDNIKFATPARRAEIEAFLEKEAEMKLQDRNVIFNGSYHPDRLPQLMGRIDWCIVPSVWWEIFCLVISEAWAFRRPVIASNVGGPAERITHEVDGLLFDVGDARALARTMRRAFTEDGLWDRLVAGITPPASRNVMVDKFMEVYGAALAKPASLTAAAE
jgi:glycosyltransferase involved in cell wall biosynthesis